MDHHLQLGRSSTEDEPYYEKQRDSSAKRPRICISTRSQHPDSDIGIVDDFCFDDEQWTIRYIVVATEPHSFRGEGADLTFGSASSGVEPSAHQREPHHRNRSST